MSDLHSVALSDLESVNRSELKDSKLRSLESCLQDAIFRSQDPIRINKAVGKPYPILNGRHRVYLARQQGLKLVPVTFG